MDKTLKPCPLCGGTAEIVNCIETPSYITYEIRCKKCGHTGQIIRGVDRRAGEEE